MLYARPTHKIEKKNILNKITQFSIREFDIEVIPKIASINRKNRDLNI